MSEEKNIVKRMAGRPKKAPIIPRSFMSPPPIASFFKKNLPKTPRRKREPAPLITPRKDCLKANKEDFWLIISGKKRVKRRPKNIPG